MCSCSIWFGPSTELESGPWLCGSGTGEGPCSHTGDVYSHAKARQYSNFFAFEERRAASYHGAQPAICVHLSRRASDFQMQGIRFAHRRFSPPSAVASSVCNGLWVGWSGSFETAMRDGGDHPMESRPSRPAGVLGTSAPRRSARRCIRAWEGATLPSRSIGTGARTRCVVLCLCQRQQHTLDCHPPCNRNRQYHLRSTRGGGRLVGNGLSTFSERAVLRRVLRRRVCPCVPHGAPERYRNRKNQSVRLCRALKSTQACAVSFPSLCWYSARTSTGG